jgi:hypothetical protein
MSLVHYGINPYWVYNSKNKTSTDRYYFFYFFSTVTFSQGESNAKKTDSVNTLLIQNLIELSIIDGQRIKTPSKGRTGNKTTVFKNNR